MCVYDTPPCMMTSIYTPFIISSAAVHRFTKQHHHAVPGWPAKVRLFGGIFVVSRLVL